MMGNKVDRYVAKYGIPGMIVCHEKDLGMVVAWIDTLPDWEDVMVRASGPDQCERGQLFFIPVPDRL